MNKTKKALAAATVAATALGGLSVALAPAATAGAAATKNFTKTFTQTCQQVGPFGQRDLGAKVTGTVPTAVKKGVAFKATKLKLTVTIPADLNTAAAATGADQNQVTFKVVNLNNTKITPKVFDVVKTDITTVKTPIVAGQTSSFVAPTTGFLTANLKAGPTAGVGTIKTGAVMATFQLFSNGSPVGGPQTVNCAAQNVPLTTVKITN